MEACGGPVGVEEKKLLKCTTFDFYEVTVPLLGQKLKKYKIVFHTVYTQPVYKKFNFLLGYKFWEFEPTRFLTRFL